MIQAYCLAHVIFLTPLDIHMPRHRKSAWSPLFFRLEATILGRKIIVDLQSRFHVAEGLRVAVANSPGLSRCTISTTSLLGTGKRGNALYNYAVARAPTKLNMTNEWELLKIRP